MHPNPDLEIFIYELPELLNNVIASELFRHCERTIPSLRAHYPVIASALFRHCERTISSLRAHYFVIASEAKQSRFRLVSCAGLRPLRSQ